MVVVLLTPEAAGAGAEAEAEAADADAPPPRRPPFGIRSDEIIRLLARICSWVCVSLLAACLNR